MRIDNLSVGFATFEPYGGHYRLTTPLWVRWDCGDKHRAFEIPSGFETDGASIPRLFWRIAGSPFDPSVMTPAIVHDWLYAVGAVPRAEADAVLRELMRISGCGVVKSWAYYFAVRACGWLHYQQPNTERNKP